MAAGKKSKRERRIKVVVYLMILAMFVSTLTMGLSMFI
ncbi:stressosome-associated protein Prli42 [Lentibacillus kimchii]|uniref:Stressosome-associated protein Prli42 n=1 Tax=Lentibacillus kimchii TaxID=1542911 RepID=A0ABW2V1K2_9BACI